MFPQERVCRVVILLSLLLLSGCKGGCGGGYVSESSLQGQELKAILEEKREVRVTTATEWPIRFEPVAIDKKTDENGTSYRANLVWQLTGLPSTIQRELETMARDVLPRREFPKREITAVTFRMQYLNQEGDDVGEEMASITIRTGSEGKLVLKNLGKKGPTYSIKATVTSAATLEQRSVDVQRSSRFPIQFDAIQFEKRTDDSRETYNGTLTWRLEGTREQVRAAMINAAGKQAADVEGQQLENAIADVDFLDPQDKSITHERVVIDLNRNSGTIRLSKVDKLPTSQKAIVRLVSIRFRGKEVDLPIN